MARIRNACLPSTASEGTCSVANNGQITFHRAPDYTGTAVCDYDIKDGAGQI